MSIKDKLKAAQELAAKPIDLSELEKKRLTQIIDLMKDTLDEILEDALLKPRDEAFTIIRKYLTAMQKKESDEAILTKTLPAKPVVHPKLDDIFAELPEDLCVKARKLLPCVKSYMKLEEKGEDGSQVLCPDCTPQKMVECIRVEDPTVIDELDRELRKAGLLK